MIVESEGERAIIPADSIHHPCQLSHPDWSVSADADRAAAVATRGALLEAHAGKPTLFIGMHWAEPAHVTRFMELIRGRHTTAATFKAAAAMGRRLGKEPCLLRKDVPGFIVNRIAYAMYREALHLLESGVADAETIDRGMRNALGLWATVCGPLRWIDLTGGPAGYAKAMNLVLPTLSKADKIPPVMRELANSNAKGIINGRGFFKYTPQEAHRWEKLYRRHALRVTAMHDEYSPLKRKTPT